MAIGLAILGLVISIVVESESAASAETAVSVDVLAEELNRRRSSFANLTAVSSWETFGPNEVSSQWAEQSLFLDHAGRIRLDQQSGGYAADGTRVLQKRERRLFNGDLGADYRFDRAENGTPVPNVQATEILIRQGQHPEGSGPLVLRNPLTVSDVSLMEALQESRRHALPISMEKRMVDGMERGLAVQAGRWLGEGRLPLQLHAMVDPEKDWTIWRQELLDDQGRVLQAFEFEYTERDGRWLPTRGSWRQLEPDTGKLRQGWRFRCAAYVVDDPNFSDQVFTIELPAGAIVRDTRTQARYKLSQQENESNLSALAQAALARQATPKPVAPTIDMPPAGGGLQPQWRWAILVLNAAALLTVVALFWLRRSRG